MAWRDQADDFWFWNPRFLENNSTLYPECLPMITEGLLSGNHTDQNYASFLTQSSSSNSSLNSSIEVLGSRVCVDFGCIIHCYTCHKPPTRLWLCSISCRMTTSIWLSRRFLFRSSPAAQQPTAGASGKDNSCSTNTEPDAAEQQQRQQAPEKENADSINKIYESRYLKIMNSVPYGQ